jgi:hypothetical protein
MLSFVGFFMSSDIELLDSITNGIFRIRNDSDASTLAIDDSLDRETLYVASRDSSSELIVTYNSGKLKEAERSFELSQNIPNIVPPSIVDVIDMDSSWDCFVMARFILSRLLVGGSDKYIRCRHSICLPNSISNLITACSIASNVMVLSIVLVKDDQASEDIISIVKPRTGPSSILSTCFDSSAFESICSFTSAVFEAVFVREENVQVLLQDQIERVATAMSVLCTEVRRKLPFLVLSVQQAGHQQFPGALSLGISKADKRSDYIYERLLDTHSAPECADGLSFRNRLNSQSGSSIYLCLPERIEGSSLTSIFLRVFAAGFCSVDLDMPSSQNLAASRIIWECLLVVVKYFELSFRLCKGSSLIITRKCITIDPVVGSPAETPDETVEFRESDSLLTIGSCVVTSLSKSGESKVSLTRSVPVATGLASVLVQASDNCQICIRTPSKNAREKIIVTFKADKTTVDTSDVLLTQLNGDVSPSNFKPVDASIRHGTDDELTVVRSKLQSLAEGETRKFSLLLVGPWNIGAGVRVIAHEGPHFEFVSERAVRDSAGLTLKCAARLFVQRTKLESPNLDELMATCELVSVKESDSRITVANKLFTALNDASSGNPYVLIKAEGDYCTFIAAMSVVVANGWSRSIQQRVETRVTTGGTETGANSTVYYITRLIVNS